MFGFSKKKEKLLDQQIPKEKESPKVVRAGTQVITQANTQIHAMSQVSERDNQDLQKKLEAKEKELASSLLAAKAAKEEAQAVQKSLANTKVKLEAKEKELASSLLAAKAAKEEAQAVQKSLANTKVKLEAKEKELGSSVYLESLQKDLDREQHKSQKLSNQLEVISLQMMLTYEDLVSYFEESEGFQKLCQVYRGRYENLKKSLPQGIYFKTLEVVKVDGVSAAPSLDFRANELLTDEFELNEFNFSIMLNDGYTGILVNIDNKKLELFPKLLGVDKNQLKAFLSFSTREFRYIMSAIGIIEQVELSSWKKVASTSRIDLDFWRSPMSELVAQSKKLTSILRYDEIKLKRVLENSDYEHLWLEIYGLSLGKSYWKKFEIRIGASLIREDGFSMHPKFELPLIDGKIKPFDSWYAESRDDAGEKLELRFSLEKNIFDFSVWSRLSQADKEILMRLIYVMPKVLGSLEKDKFMLHRPLEAWIKLANDSIKVVESYKSNKSITPSLPQGQSIHSDNKSINLQIKKQSTGGEVQFQQAKESENKAVKANDVVERKLMSRITKQKELSTKKLKITIKNGKPFASKKRSKS